MGLTLIVGMLPSLSEDAEGEVWFRESMAKVNRLLASHDLPAHEEPACCEEWGADMFGYSGLHYLRRLACHVDATGSLPGPGTRESSSDPMLEAYWAAWQHPVRSRLARILGLAPSFDRAFDHLVLHSDAEGCYVPIDHDEVLVGDDGIVGFVPALLRECDRLAAMLSIPDSLHTDSTDLWEAAGVQDANALETWRRYGVESFTCVALREGCRHSLETGAALVFS